MIPAAVGKAESLARFAKSQGSPLSDFALALTLGEGYELLDFLAAGGMGLYANHQALRADIAEAKAEGNPFTILSQFQIFGLAIVPASELH